MARYRGMNGLHELLLPEEFREAETLLESRGLELPEGISFGLGLYEENRLIGTGFLTGDILCGIGVAAGREGKGVSAAIVTELLNHALGQGFRTLRLFTKPAEAPKFAALGFSPLVTAPEAALLEWGEAGYPAWLAATRTFLTRHEIPARHEIPTAPGRKDSIARGAVVMNANPFTLGHRFLVMQALERCDTVLVFVVEEEASAFPFPVRLRLVREGLADLPEALVLPAGPYMVSRASFPSYFTGKERHARVHAELDCALFARKIAPDLGIGLRAVGTEPLCPVTALYNEIMRRILPESGIQCLEVPRYAADGGEAVSASAVRAGLAGTDDSAWRALVPRTTYAFLTGPEADAIRAGLREKKSRH